MVLFVKYTRILPVKNDPEAMTQFIKVLIRIAQRLQNQKPPLNESQGKA